MRRSGSVCDTLVFLLVATLLPAWLLGHLFLMFFPATGDGLASQVGMSDPPVAVATLEDNDASDADETDGMIELLSEEPETAASSQRGSGEPNSQWEREVGNFESTISDLQTENRNLSLEATELAKLNSEQQKEIDNLESRLQQISKQNGQGQIKSMSMKLQDTQDDYARLDERFKRLQDEKSQLSREVADLKSANQRLAMAPETTGSGNTQTSEALVAASKKLLADSNQEKSQLQNRVDELTAALGTAESSFAVKKRELADAKNQLQQLNAKYAQTLRRLRKEDDFAGDAKPTPPTQSNLVETSRRSSRPQNTEQYREYVSSRGNRSRLAFIKWIEDEQVVVRSFLNKQLYQVPIERFSLADQKYLRSLKLTNGQ